MKLPALFRRRTPAPAPEIISASREPQRDTVPYPALLGLGAPNAKRIVYKPTPRNLRYFSRTVYARRAINAIKGPISSYGWEVAPIKGVTANRTLRKQAEIATRCLAHPNHSDSFRSMLEAVTEDILMGGGAIELQTGTDPLRPLWMYPVDGTTISIYAGWDGDPEQARYAQTLGYGYEARPLRSDELIYIRPNPSTASPYGLGALEVAFNSISRQLGVSEYAGNVASNARPSIGLDLGDGGSPEIVAAFRTYWRNEVEGQGQMPIFSLSGSGDGKGRGASTVKFNPEGDSGLYLKWQEFLKAEIATAFDISPQNLGVERDVNRSTSEVAEDRDRDHAINPLANLIAAHITRDAIHHRLGFYNLEFRFLGMNPEDEEALSKIYERMYKSNALTGDEWRSRFGLPPMDGVWGAMTFADVQIATMAARSGEVVDPDLDNFTTRPAPEKAPN